MIKITNYCLTYLIYLVFFKILNKVNKVNCYDLLVMTSSGSPLALMDGGNKHAIYCFGVVILTVIGMGFGRPDFYSTKH